MCGIRHLCRAVPRNTVAHPYLSVHIQTNKMGVDHCRAPSVSACTQDLPMGVGLQVKASCGGSAGDTLPVRWSTFIGGDVSLSYPPAVPSSSACYVTHTHTLNTHSLDTHTYQPKHTHIHTHTYTRTYSHTRICIRRRHRHMNGRH